MKDVVRVSPHRLHAALAEVAPVLDHVVVPGREEVRFFGTRLDVTVVEPALSCVSRVKMAVGSGATTF